jgi:predicted transcriptional regulator of viral defense system
VIDLKKFTQDKRYVIFNKSNITTRVCNIMKNRVQLLQCIPTENFDLKEARNVGLGPYDLELLQVSGDVIKVRRGVYQKASFDSFQDESLHAALISIGRPSAICLLSAFAFYGLTDEIPNRVWIYVPINKNSHIEEFKVVRKRNPCWDIGIVDIDGVVITDIERTVVDALSDRKHVSESDSMKIAKTALREKKTSLEAISSMAKKLGVYNRMKFKLMLLQDEYV